MSLVSGSSIAATDLAKSRNVIINGNMDIWQRGTSFAFAGVSSGYTTDRYNYVNLGSASVTASRSTDVPTYAQSGTKSNYSLLLDVTTANTPLNIDFVYTLNYTIEGYDYARISGGDATLSFWVKGTKTGIHTVAFKNSGSDRTFIREYTVNTTDTWEKKTITVPLTETGGTWDYTNGVGLGIIFTIGAGTDYHSTKDTWNSNGIISTSNQVNVLDSTANNFRVAQVQLEKGQVTDFEYKSAADELARCYRYYYRSDSGNIDYALITMVTAITAVLGRGVITLPAEMRAAMTFSLTGAVVMLGGLGAPSSVVMLDDEMGDYRRALISMTLATSTMGYSGELRFDNATGYFDFDADF